MHFKIDLHGHTFMLQEAIFFKEMAPLDSIRNNPEDFYVLFRRGTKAPKEEQSQMSFFYKRPLGEGDEDWMHFELDYYDDIASRAFIKYFNSYIYPEEYGHTLYIPKR
jgi:hypothetical protein